jgi:hypothetical protein
MKGSQESLTTVVIKGWPTPNAADSLQGGSTQGNRKDPNLSIAVHGPAAPASSSTPGSRLESWATPRAGKTTDENPETWAKRQAKGDVATMPLTAQVKTWQTATVSTGANRQKDGSMTDKLDQQVKNWATPRVHEHMEPPHQWQARNIKKKAENPKLGTLDKPLGTMVMEQKNWATPDASDRRSDKSKQVGLSNQTKTWATPANHDGTTGTKVNSPFKSLVGDVEKITPLTQGKLNPRWVETLMGLPVGWTMPSCASPVTIERMSSDSSVTVLSQQQQNEPSEA